MIHIHRPQIEETTDGICRVIYQIEEDEPTSPPRVNQKNLTFEFDAQYAQYLSIDRGDHLLSMLLLYAMREKQDMKFDMPISERLYYQITTYLIDALHQADPNYAKINVTAELEKSDYVKDPSRRKVVGTGMSCGVDALCTYYTHNYENTCEDYKINILTFFNIGAFQYGDGVQVRNYYADRAWVQQFAEEAGLPLMTVDSNFAELFLHTSLANAMRNCGVILMFQKLFDVYYHSSTYTLNEFHFDPKIDSAYYEVFLLPCLTTNSTTFYSSNTSYSRFRKTLTISDFEMAHKYLDVCYYDSKTTKNCGTCGKCVRTLVTLDAIDKLDDFSELFDLSQYRKRRNMNLGYALASRKESFYREIFPALKSKNNFSLMSYLYCCIFTLAKPMEKWMLGLPPEKRRALVKFAEKMHVRVPY